MPSMSGPPSRRWARRCPTGPLLRQGYAVPRHLRYYDPIRQSCDHLRPRLAACAIGLTITRPSLLWVIAHSLGATTYTPEQTTVALARYLHRRPLAFALAGGARLLDTPRPVSRGKPFRRFAWCSLSLRPQVSLALLTGRTFRPRGLLPELTPSTVAHRERQALLRSQTGQLLRRDFHPHGQRRYRLHPAHGLPTVLTVWHSRGNTRCRAACTDPSPRADVRGATHPTGIVIAVRPAVASTRQDGGTHTRRWC